MEKLKLFRHVIGYMIGISIFGILIPYGLTGYSNDSIPFFNFPLIENTIFRYILVFIFLLTGLLFMIWSNAALFMIGKGGPADGFGIAVSPRTEKLVIKGPYRYSRNPMVLGAFLFYFSIAIYKDSTGLLVILILCIPITILYLKLTEEKRLFHDFGNEFLEYRKKVPMIFPFAKIKK